MERRSLIKVLPIALIALTCVWQMAGVRQEFLVTVANLTPFYTTWGYFADVCREPGGFLLYCSAGLTSLFAKPWVGTVVFTLLACLLPLLQPSRRRKEFAHIMVSSSIALLLLLNFTQQGYIIYVLKAPATGLSPFLGFMAIGVLTWCADLFCDRLYNKVGLAVAYSYLAAVILVGYHFFGFYALFASLLILTRFLRKMWKSSHIRKDARKCDASFIGYILASLAIALLLAWPCFLVTYCYTNIGIPQCYMAALPDYRMLSSEWLLWLPIIVALALTLFLDNVKLEKKGVVLSCLLLVASFVCVLRFSYKDANFSQILRMSLAVDDADWDTVLNISRRSEAEPTRAEVLFRNIALQKLGRAGDELFQFPDGDAEYKAVRDAQYLRIITAIPLYYYYGKINFSYRWCMEDLVEYSLRPICLKYMSLCAIMNGERALARKYLNQLSHTWAYDDFVQKYLRYIDNPRLIEQDKVMSDIKNLMNFNDLLDGDSGLIEVYLLNSFGSMEGGTREMVEISLQDNLIMKDINGFWPRFFALLPTFKGKIPVHYQEAALLFNALQPNYDLSQLPIDQSLKTEFGELVQASEKNSSMGDEYNATALRPQFGRTYWYYYFFVKGLKTN